MLKAVYCVTEHTKYSRVSTRSIFYQLFVNTPNTLIFVHGYFPLSRPKKYYIHHGAPGIRVNPVSLTLLYGSYA